MQENLIKLDQPTKEQKQKEKGEMTYIKRMLENIGKLVF